MAINGAGHYSHLLHGNSYRPSSKGAETDSMIDEDDDLEKELAILEKKDHNPQHSTFKP